MVTGIMTNHKSPTNEDLAWMRRDAEKKGIREIPYLIEEIRQLQERLNRSDMTKEGNAGDAAGCVPGGG